MQSTHTIHTQSLGHRTQLGKGEKRREGRLVSDYSLNACNEPENLLCAQIRSCCGQMDPDTATDLRRRTESKECTTNRCCCCPFHIPFATLLLSSPLPSISVSLLCLCHPVYLLCLQRGRKKKVQEKGGKDLRAILDTTNKLKKLTSSRKMGSINLQILCKRVELQFNSIFRNT